MSRVTPEEAHALMSEGFTYVDVRTEDEFAAGHPTNAINVPLDDAFVIAIEGRFAKDAALIVGCKSGNRSRRAFEALAAAGFTRVVDQAAGWDGVRGTFGEVIESGWLRARLPITR